MTKIKLDSNSKVERSEIISLAQIDISHFEGDQLRSVCISESLLTTAKAVISIASGIETENLIGDQILHSDDNLLVAAKFLDKQGL